MTTQVSHTSFSLADFRPDPAKLVIPDLPCPLDDERFGSIVGLGLTLALAISSQHEFAGIAGSGPSEHDRFAARKELSQLVAGHGLICHGASGTTCRQNYGQ